MIRFIVFLLLTSSSTAFACSIAGPEETGGTVMLDRFDQYSLVVRGRVVSEAKNKEGRYTTRLEVAEIIYGKKKKFVDFYYCSDNNASCEMECGLHPTSLKKGDELFFHSSFADGIAAIYSGPSFSKKNTEYQKNLEFTRYLASIAKEDSAKKKIKVIRAGPKKYPKNTLVKSNVEELLEEIRIAKEWDKIAP